MNGYNCYCEPSRDYEDCRYYSVEFDIGMGANIPHCTLNPPPGMKAFSYHPCIDNNGKCEQYISKKDPNGDFISGQQKMAYKILEIIDDADKKANDKSYIVLDDGRFYSQAKYIKEKMLELLDGYEG